MAPVNWKKAEQLISENAIRIPEHKTQVRKSFVAASSWEMKMDAHQKHTLIGECKPLTSLDRYLQIMLIEYHNVGRKNKSTKTIILHKYTTNWKVQPTNYTAENVAVDWNEDIIRHHVLRSSEIKKNTTYDKYSVASNNYINSQR